MTHLKLGVYRSNIIILNRKTYKKKKMILTLGGLALNK